jgi:subtilisin family serine protease
MKIAADPVNPDSWGRDDGPYREITHAGVLFPAGVRSLALACVTGLILISQPVRAASLDPPTFIVEPVDESAALELRKQGLPNAGDATHGMRFVRTLATGHLLFEASSPGFASSPALIRSLRDHPWIADVQVNRLMTASTPVSVRGSARDKTTDAPSWNHADTPAGANVASAWALSRGANTVVAVVDSGITAHPDLEGRVLPGYDFISSWRRGRDGDGRDADPSDEGLEHCDIGLPRWHGTQVAGLVAARGGNGETPIGVAPETSILPVRVLGSDGGTTADIAEAIIWAAGGHVEDVPDNRTPAQVINLSLGGNWPCDAFTASAIRIATQLGATVVAAAGNGNLDASMTTPAGCPGVLTVAATNRFGARARYSNFGPAVRLAAPGGNTSPVLTDGIWTTTNRGCSRREDPTYTWFDGTSAAAPHVSGAAALLRAANPALEPRDVRDMIIDTASPLPVACPEGCGSGLLDVASAVRSAIDEGMNK